MSVTLDLLAAAALGYLLGSIPSAALVARLRGRAIFEVGSGNMGAMNTARNLGFALGALVLIMDVAKGAATSVAGLALARASGLAGDAALLPALTAGVGAMLGHAFSAFVGLRGGKGLATAFGLSLPLYPLGGIFGLVLLVALTLLLRRATDLAAILTVVLYPLVAFLTALRNGAPPERSYSILLGVSAVAMVSIAKHLLALRARPRA